MFNEEGGNSRIEGKFGETDFNMILDISAHLLNSSWVLWGTGRDRHRPTLPRGRVTDTFPRWQMLSRHQAKAPRIRGGCQGRTTDRKDQVVGLRGPRHTMESPGEFFVKKGG